MAYLDLWEIREEIVVFLRNSNIFTTTQRGVSTTTEEFDGDALETDFVLMNTPVRNVRSVTVGGVAQTLGTDYTVDYSTATVSFTSAPAGGTDNVDVQYDYGNTDKIFPDFPRTDLSITNFPRIGVDLIGVESEPGGFGNVVKNNIDFTVVVYGLSTKDISDYISSIRQSFISNYNSLSFVSPVYPLRVGPVLKFDTTKGKDKIVQQNADFRGYFIYEIN